MFATVDVRWRTQLLTLLNQSLLLLPSAAAAAIVGLLEGRSGSPRDCSRSLFGTPDEKEAAERAGAAAALGLACAASSSSSKALLGRDGSAARHARGGLKGWYEELKMSSAAAALHILLVAAELEPVDQRST